MDRKSRYILYVCCVFTLVQGLNIRQIIEQRSDLSQLRRYLGTQSRLLKRLGQDNSFGKFTFFAPSNEAFGNLTEQQRRVLFQPTSSNALQELFNYHTVYSIDSDIYDTSKITVDGIRVQSMASGPVFLYLRHLGMNYYVNNAHLVVKDLDATNGVVHVIDRFSTEAPKATNGMGLLEENSNKYRQFYELLVQYERYEMHTAIDTLSFRTTTTLFIPTDSAFNRVPQQRRTALRQDKDMLRKVIEAHIIQDKSYFSRMFTGDMVVQAMSGTVTATRIGNDVYVSTDCVQGKVVNENIVLAYGVAHEVDSILGFLYNDVWGQLRDDSITSSMGDFVNRGPVEIQDLFKSGMTEVSLDAPLTVFAPTNEAFANIRRVIDLTQNATALSEILRMHIVQRRLEVKDMYGGLEDVDTMRPAHQMKFRLIRNQLTYTNDLYVEVDHVRAKVVRGNVCTRNGLVHYVDQVLGFPYQTAMEYISTQPASLSSLQEAIERATLEVYYGDKFKRFTLFAPNDTAWDLIKQTTKGAELLLPLNAKVLERVLYRHTLPQELFLDTMAQGTGEYIARFESVSVTRNGEQYTVKAAGVTARVVKADIRVTNGVVHVIDKVLFDPNPLASEWTSAAPRQPATRWTVLVCLVLMCILFRLN